MKVVNMGFSLTMIGLCFYFWARSEESDDATIQQARPPKTA